MGGVGPICSHGLIATEEIQPFLYSQATKKVEAADAAAAAAKSLQSCPTLCKPIDGSPPGSPDPGILHERALERVTISFSNA